MNENYQIKKVGGWALWLGLISFLSCGLFLFLYLAEDHISILSGVIGMGGLSLIGFSSDLEIKAKRDDDDPLLLHFSSKQNYILYRIYRFISVTIGIISILILGILGFIWFGNITIAPTSIIIFLIVLILFKK